MKLVLLQKVRSCWKCSTKVFFEHLHKPLHICYFAAVAIEAHGFYGIAAGGLLIVTIYDSIAGDKGE